MEAEWRKGAQKPPGNQGCIPKPLLLCDNDYFPTVFLYMGASENGGTPKSSILIGFSLINHPFWGAPIFGNTHIFQVIYIAGAWKRFGAGLVPKICS